MLLGPLDLKLILLRIQGTFLSFEVNISTYFKKNKLTQSCHYSKISDKTIFSSIVPKVTDKVMNKDTAFSFMKLKQNFQTTTVDYFTS